MKSIKLGITILFMSLINCLHAQFSHGHIQLGFTSGKMNMDNFHWKYAPPAQQGGEGTIYGNTEGNFKLPSVQIALEQIHNKFYIYTGTNMAIKPGRTIDSMNSTGNKIFEQNFVFFKAAYGWGGDHFSFLIGGQYEFNRFKVEGDGSPYTALSTFGVGPDMAGQYYIDYLGGHQYGVNFNILIAPTSFIGLRGSLFLDKTKTKGIPGNVHADQLFDGGVVRPEAALYIYAGEDKNFGLKVTYTFAKRSMNYYPNRDKTEAPSYVPESVTTRTSYLNFSLMLKAPWYKD